MSGRSLPETAEAAVHYTMEILRSGTGTGATPDSPFRLGPIHPVLAPITEKALISCLFGTQFGDWGDEGRTYHKNNKICEQRVRLPSGEVKPVFFDISELTNTAPLADELRKKLASAAKDLPVRDTTFVSRFPLVEIKAKNAAEAARTIAGYLAQAKAQGWSIGNAAALVDDWRTEYELLKGGENTVMRFDMRPTLLADSRLSLVALTLIAGTPKLEEVIRNFESSASWPEAFAAAGLSFVDTSQRERISPTAAPALKATEAPYLVIRAHDIVLNHEAYQDHTAVVLGKDSTFQMPCNDAAMIFATAKIAGWSGNNVEKLPNGDQVFKIQDFQDLSDASAFELSIVLTQFCKTHSESENYLVKTAGRLARIASAGGFSIRFENVKYKPNPQSQSHTGTSSKKNLSSFVPGDSPIEKHAKALIAAGIEHKAPLGSLLARAVKRKKRYQNLIPIISLLMLVAMFGMSAFVYTLTASPLLAIIGFFSPFLVFGIVLWVIMAR